MAEPRKEIEGEYSLWHLSEARCPKCGHEEGEPDRGNVLEREFYSNWTSIVYIEYWCSACHHKWDGKR